jgi:single-strand DNA-binding protein
MEQGETNWYTVTAFRQLAQNVGSSVQKGDRVVVTGRLKIRKWESGQREGMVVEIDAEAIGHDLAWGTSTFTRIARPPRAVESASAPLDEIETASSGAPTDGFVPDSSTSAATDASGWALPAMVGAPT